MFMINFCFPYVEAEYKQGYVFKFDAVVGPQVIKQHCALSYIKICEKEIATVVADSEAITKGSLSQINYSRQSSTKLLNFLIKRILILFFLLVG